VVHVDDEVSRGQPFQDVPRNDAPQSLGSAHANRTEELAVGNQGEPVGTAGEAAVQAPADQGARPWSGRLRQAIDHGGGKLLLGQQVGQARSLVGGQDDSVALARPARNGLGQALGPGGRQRRFTPAEEIAHGRPAAGRRSGFRFPRQLQGSPAQQPPLPFALTQVRLGPVFR
jgi:hypothetical protein